MEKYYTPTLEEFCVGFEYEVLQKAPKKDPFVFVMQPELEEDTWFKQKYPDPFLGYRIDKIFKTYVVRVKYLDKKDIKSFNFTETKSLGDLNWRFVVQGYNKRVHEEDGYRYWNLYLNYYPDLKTLKIKADTSDGEHSTFFNGVIKNKFELKKLLTQLNINV